MSYLKKLSKNFVNSAVKQVGRDGGRVISNKVYKGKHSKPIYYHDPNGSTQKITQKQTFETDPLTEIDWDIQPNIMKSSPIVTFIKAFLINLVPFVGFIVVVYKAVHSFTLKSTPVFQSIPNKIQDNRYKEGFRVEGNIITESMIKRELLPEEKSYFKRKGLIYILATVVLYLIVYLISESGLLDTAG